MLRFPPTMERSALTERGRPPRSGTPPDTSNEGPGSFFLCARARRLQSLHEPAVADDQRLTGERVRLEGSEEQRCLGGVPHCGELPVDRVLEHDVPDHRRLGNAELPRLLRNLLVD